MVQRRKTGKTLKVLSKKEYEKLLRYTKYHVSKITDIEAEDILHEVAFKVFNKVDFESPVENVVAYLYRSVKNKIAEVLRKPKRVISFDSFSDVNMYSEVLENTKNEHENLDNELGSNNLYDKLHQAVQQLPFIYRSIIIATEFEGKTIKELSKEWGIPMGTLLSRRHRALAKLHDMLENNYFKF